MMRFFRMTFVPMMVIFTAFCQAAGAKTEEHEELERALMSCTWTYHNPLVKVGLKSLRFWTDSAVTSGDDPNVIFGIWHVTGEGEVSIHYSPVSTIKLSFDKERKKFTGEDGENRKIDGGRLEPLLPKGAVKKLLPAAASIDSRTGQKQIDVVTAQAATITAGVIVPLDATALDHRAAIIALRDNLLDESAAHPSASPAAYQLASRLCNAWLVCLDERDKKLVSYGQTRPSSIMGAARATHYRAGDYYLYLRDATEAHRKELEDWKLAQFFNDGEKKRWADRCLTLKRGLDAQQAQLDGAVKSGATTGP